jgi:hypothetical protein
LTPPAGLASVPQMDTKARLDLSRQVIAGWERTPPGGRFRDTMAMIREELAILRRIKAEDPGMAAQVDQLEYRYGRLALRLSFAN